MNVVRDEDGTWLAVDNNGHVLRSGFRTNDEGWRWLDQQDDDEIEDADRRVRIRQVFSGEER